MSLLHYFLYRMFIMPIEFMAFVVLPNSHPPLFCKFHMGICPSSPLVLHPLCNSLRSEEHTSELQSRPHLVCRLLLEKKKKPGNEKCSCTHCRLKPINLSGYLPKTTSD